MGAVVRGGRANCLVNRGLRDISVPTGFGDVPGETALVSVRNKTNIFVGVGSFYSCFHILRRLFGSFFFF